MKASLVSATAGPPLSAGLELHHSHTKLVRHQLRTPADMRTALHDRLSVSGPCFPGRATADVLDALAGTGARHTTLQVPVVSEAGQAAGRGRSEALGVAVEALIGGGGPVLDDRA